jgi:hypothetical protein
MSHHVQTEEGVSVLICHTFNTCIHVVMLRPSLQRSSHAGVLVGSSNRLSLALTPIHCTNTMLW